MKAPPFLSNKDTLPSPPWQMDGTAKAVRAAYTQGQDNKNQKGSEKHVLI